MRRKSNAVGPRKVQKIEEKVEEKVAKLRLRTKVQHTETGAVLRERNHPAGRDRLLRLRLVGYSQTRQIISRYSLYLSLILSLVCVSSLLFPLPVWGCSWGRRPTVCCLMIDC